MYTLYMYAVLPEMPVRSRHADQYGNQESEAVKLVLIDCLGSQQKHVLLPEA